MGDKRFVMNYSGPISVLANELKRKCKFMKDLENLDTHTCCNCRGELEEIDDDTKICMECGNLHDSNGNEY